MQVSDIDEAQIEHLTSLMGRWKKTCDAGASTGLLADMIFHMETGKVLGADCPAYSNIIDFCDILTFCTKDRRLTVPEVLVLANAAKQQGLDYGKSLRIKELRDSVAPRKWWQVWRK